MKYGGFLLILVALLSGCSAGQKRTNEPLSLIPKPDSVQMGKSQFRCSSNMKILVANDSLFRLGNYLSENLYRQTRLKPVVQKSNEPVSNSIFLTIGLHSSKPEAYQLSVDNRKIIIEGASCKGLVWGIQSLRQLIDTVQGSTQAVIPCLTLKDQPRFSYRGIMLDVSRHFFTTDEVEQLIDMMSLYKLNKLHLHLTDDQGWRLEIKKYPELLQSAFRTPNKANKDQVCEDRAKSEDNSDFLLNPKLVKVDAKGQKVYGGFYTQADIKHLVAYAALRGIEIIPEIDMPGHFMAVLQEHPELSCFGKVGWGQMFSTPLCPGKDSSLTFCKHILDEVFTLFPSHYIHIGGDEVEYRNWEKCPDCRARMKKYGCKNPKQLEAWFIHEIEKYINAHGRKMIGWDEIIDGGLSSTSTVMYWRNSARDAVRLATAHGNQVIQSPDPLLYFDAEQDENVMPDIYAFDPVTPELNQAQAKLVIGAQGNIWTTRIPSMSRLWYKTLPRMFALSEITWTNKAKKNWPDFQRRLMTAYRQMDKKGITYRIPQLKGFCKTNAFVGETQVKVQSPFPNMIIRYTADGSVPTRLSAVYDHPIRVTDNAHFRFRGFLPNGHKGDTYDASYIKQEYSKSVDVVGVKPGILCDWHLTLVDRCAKILKAPVYKSYVLDQIKIPDGAAGKLGLVFTGYVQVPERGIYTFSLGSDDGAQLYIDDQLTVDHDCPSVLVETTGQKALEKGWHKIKVMYFDMNNGGDLYLHITDASGKQIPLDSQSLKH